ncbi:MAG: hypothetical protein R3202_07455 [Candidatus Competibacterales bacterium]|nr:hypothetical protein [Candidatus Competibacterales bacterium]
MATELALEMGLNHNEFFRTLPAAMGELSYRIEDHQVVAEHDDRRLTIRLDPQSERRIALLRVPYTWVRFRFEDYSESEVKAFMDRFQRHFQRGGG